MLSLLLLHYWKETTDRGRRQQRRGEILASWKGGNVFKREHLTPLTPGKRVKVINICVSAFGKLWEAFPEVWPCAVGWFPWCRAVLFGSLQGVVDRFPLWVDPGTVSGTEGHQKPQYFDYVELKFVSVKPHSTKTACWHWWCGHSPSGRAGNISSALLWCRDFLSGAHCLVCACSEMAV